MLWRSGTFSAPHFYVSGYFEENKDENIDTIRRVPESGNWDEWCSFFLVATEQQAIRNLTIAENIRALYEEMKQKFSEILSSKWNVVALDFVFTNPVFRNNKFTSNSGIPSATAARSTRAMPDNNIIITIEEASGRFVGIDSELHQDTNNDTYPICRTPLDTNRPCWTPRHKKAPAGGAFCTFLDYSRL